MSDPRDVDRLISVLGDELSRPRAQRLINDAGGNLEVAINAYFSVPGRPLIAPASPRDRLRTLLGSSVSQQRLDQLIEVARGNVERAVDIHFSGDLFVGDPSTHCMLKFNMSQISPTILISLHAHSCSCRKVRYTQLIAHVIFIPCLRISTRASEGPNNHRGRDIKQQQKRSYHC